MLTTKQAAERLGVTPRYIRALISSGKLKAARFGRDLMIDDADLDALQRQRPGRPRGANYRPRKRPQRDTET